MALRKDQPQRGTGFQTRLLDYERARTLDLGDQSHTSFYVNPAGIPSISIVLDDSRCRTHYWSFLAHCVSVYVYFLALQNLGALGFHDIRTNKLGGLNGNNPSPHLWKHGHKGTGKMLDSSDVCIRCMLTFGMLWVRGVVDDIA